MSPDDLPEDTMWKDLLTMGRCQVLEFMEELADSRIPNARPDVVMQAICCIGAFALEPDVYVVVLGWLVGWLVEWLVGPTLGWAGLLAR